MFSICDPVIFRAREQWRGKDYTPKAGDLVFFDWVQDGYQGGEPDYVGIVEKVEDGVLYPIEENSGDACRRNSYCWERCVFMGLECIDRPNYRLYECLSIERKYNRE